MAGRGVRKPNLVGLDEDVLEHLIAISSAKTFENLSWRLVRLLADGVRVERRELGRGARLTIEPGIEAMYFEQASLELQLHGADAGSHSMWKPYSRISSDMFAIPAEKPAGSFYKGSSPLRQEGTYSVKDA